MRTLTIDAHIDGKPATVLAIVYDGTNVCPSVCLCDLAFSTWTAYDRAFPLHHLDEGIEELYDSAFLEACQEEDEDYYEAIEASKTNF